MSFNKVNRALTSSVNGPTHGGINDSHFAHDQNEPRANGISTGSKSGGRPQSRISQVGGLHPRGTNANQPTHHTQAFGSHRVPSQKDGSGVPRRAGEPGPNFLDLALEESGEDSDNDGDEWEEVACPVNEVVDRPLIAASSGFTLPTRGKRSDFLTLEVVEDWEPSSLPATPLAVRTAPHEDLDHFLVQEPASEQDDSHEADLQLAAELAEGLASLNTPAPGPSRRQRSWIPNGGNSGANSSPPIRPPAHPKLGVVEQPSPARTPVKGKGMVTDREPAERPRKVRKYVDPPRAPSPIDDQPTRKPTVSFKKKATELARLTGRLLPPSKPLPPHNTTTIPSFSTTGGPPSTPNNPTRPCTEATSISNSSRPISQLFMSKGFSSHAQTLRERRTEATLRQFNKRYGGIIVEHARRDLTDLMSEFTSAGSLGASKGTKPTQRRQVRRTTDGKWISKAQAQAEEVMRICGSTKSYIVDLAAIKRREDPTPTIAPPSVLPPPVRSEKVAPRIVSHQVSTTRPAGRSPAPQLPSTSPGSVPQGLKFSRKQRPAPESGEIVVETAGRVASSERSARGPILASANRDNGPRTMDTSKRRREDSGRESEGSSPWKKPRLGRS